MVKVLRFYLFFIFIFQIFVSQLQAEIIWGNKYSTLRVLSGAHLNISTTSFVVEGIFEKESDTTLSGNSIAFDGGVFINEGTSLALTGTLGLDANQLLDASGAALVFLNPDNQQVTIAQNQTLSLQNIVYSRINASTFQFGLNSTLNIGSSVIWELSDDIIFNQANIVLTGESDTFIIRGIGGKKRVTLPYNALLVLGTNTLILEDIEFIGLEQVQVTSTLIDGQPVVGAIALSGNASVHIIEDSGVNFVVEGVDNELRLAKNNLLLNGVISFSDDSIYNELHINATILNQGDIVPQVNFGDSCISVASELGFAQLIFDKSLKVINATDSSFVLGDHAHLAGQFLEVLNNPIQQTSAFVSIDKGLILSSDQSNAINTAVVRSLTRFDLFNTRPVTALHIQRKKDRGRVPVKPQIDYHGVYLKPYHWQPGEYNAKPHSRKRVKKARPAFLQNIINRQRTRSFDDIFRSNPFNLSAFDKTRAQLESDNLRSFDQVGQERKRVKSVVTRAALDANTNYDIKYLNTVKLGSASGVILLDGALATEFNASDTDPLQLTLKNNASVIQGADDVVINSGSALTIIGTGNKITVAKSFTLEGDLIFDEGALLTIEFSSQGNNPMFIIASSNNIVLKPGVVLEFKGRGTVQCADGTFFKLSDTPSTYTTPSFIVRDGALVSLQQDAITTFSGTGKINLINNGGIDLNLPSQIIIGNSPTDNIDLFLQGGNILLDLGESSTTPQANLSFPQGKYSLQVNGGGLISVGDGGRLEFNTLDGQTYSTYEQIPSAFIKSISLTPGGIFRVDGGGQVVFGENKRTDVAGPGLIGTEINFPWDSLATRFGGTGLIGFVSQDDDTLSFMGQLQSNASAVSFRNKLITAEDLVRTLIQKNSTLLVSTLFVDIDGNNTIRTVDGILVTLDENTIVTGDDSDGNIFLFNSKTKRASSINAAGK